MSLLGIEFDVKGWIFKPFYLLLGLLSLCFLIVLLGLSYGMVYVKNTLVNRLNKV